MSLPSIAPPPYFYRAFTVIIWGPRDQSRGSGKGQRSSLVRRIPPYALSFPTWHRDRRYAVHPARLLTGPSTLAIGVDSPNYLPSPIRIEYGVIPSKTATPSLD